MQQWTSVDEILDFAVGQEEQAAQFYTDLAGRMERPWMSKIFEAFAREEMGHKRILLEVKTGKRLLNAEQKVVDLKIGDYLVDVEPSPDMDYQDALIVAMKKEKKAFKMYNDLAEATDDENLQTTFLSLAQEEAKHKLRFEIEYDDYVMAEN
ncbi:MAG: ferritin family protein [Deltaproteobacteria bacterium]